MVETVFAVLYAIFDILDIVQETSSTIDAVHPVEV